MKTPAQLETILHRGFAGIDEPAQEFRVKIAKAEYMKIRARYGFSSLGTLLSGDISKLQKSDGVNLGLAFPPAISSHVANVCAFAGDCASTCVAFSGNGGFSTTQAVRAARLDFAIEQPLFFAILIWEELRKATQSDTYAVAIRLNTYSDIRWERVAPNLFEYFSRSTFYDYTKHPQRSRPAHTLPSNYRLTYSLSEKTTAAEFARNIDAGRNVAAVVAVRSGSVPAWREIPSTFAGLPTIDGDQTDARHLDPLGVVVLLRRKHTLKASSGLIAGAAVIAEQYLKAAANRSGSTRPVSASPHLGESSQAAAAVNDGAARSRKRRRAAN